MVTVTEIKLPELLGFVVTISPAYISAWARMSSVSPARLFLNRSQVGVLKPLFITEQTAKPHAHTIPCAAKESGFID